MRLLFLLAACGLVSCAGRPGSKGDAGLDGAPAQSCTVTQLPDGALIICPDGSAAAISNGVCKKEKKHE